MGNSVSMYDVMLDGEIVTDLPRPVIDALQSVMKDHNALVVMRRPEIKERDIQLDDNSVIIDDSVKRLEDAINLQRNQITEAINATVNAFNNQVNDLKRSLSDITKQPQNDTSSIKTTIDLLAGRLNDALTALPLTLQDKFNNQTDRLIDSINDTLRPKDSINATIKGAAYEQEVVQQFEALKLDTLSIERVSTEHHVCDIHVIDTMNDILYAVECKNYTSTVGRDQLTKFKRDLEELRSRFTRKTVIGMFLSKQTRIVEHGMMDIDEEGNVYLAGEYNTPDMWRAVIIYFARLKRSNRLIGQQISDNDEHMKVLLSAYQAMKDAESIQSIITVNVNRVNEMLKDLQSMASKVKPLSEIIEQLDKIYQFNTKPKKVGRPKKTKQEPIVKAEEQEQIDISPSVLSFSDSDEEDTEKIKPKTKKMKVSKKDDTIKPKQEKVPSLCVVKANHSSIGWSDDD